MCSSTQGFNSRSPSGLRQYATKFEQHCFVVSIHAAQAGCDQTLRQTRLLGSVSIHAAQAGCDKPNRRNTRHTKVSIHAAQAGCDLLLPLMALPVKGFNSRSPSGLRLDHQCGLYCTAPCFNSRSPSGLRPSAQALTSFSSWFQFTQPKRAATDCIVALGMSFVVSIHAAQAGCDQPDMANPEFGHQFQFTQPKRAATEIFRNNKVISTFQFTQPKRAATCC